eukprot:g13419.t1
MSLRLRDIAPLHQQHVSLHAAHAVSAPLSFAEHRTLRNASILLTEAVLFVLNLVEVFVMVAETQRCKVYFACCCLPPVRGTRPFHFLGLLSALVALTLVTSWSSLTWTGHAYSYKARLLHERPQDGWASLEPEVRSAVAQDLRAHPWRTVTLLAKSPIESPSHPVELKPPHIGVWGVALGYSAEQLLKFALPLRQHGFKGEIRLVVWSDDIPRLYAHPTLAQLNLVLVAAPPLTRTEHIIATEPQSGTVAPSWEVALEQAVASRQAMDGEAWLPPDVAIPWWNWLLEMLWGAAPLSQEAVTRIRVALLRFAWYRLMLEKGSASPIQPTSLLNLDLYNDSFSMLHSVPEFVILCDVRDTFFQADPTPAVVALLRQQQQQQQQHQQQEKEATQQQATQEQAEIRQHRQQQQHQLLHQSLPSSSSSPSLSSSSALQPPPELLIFFSEGQPVGASRCNRRWIEACCAVPRKARVPLEADILNGGLIAGTRTEMLYFLKEMLSAVEQMRLVRGLDQAILSYWKFAENGFARAVFSRPAQPGSIGSIVGLAKDLYINLLSFGNQCLLNANGELAPILHQYDRSALAHLLVERQYKLCYDIFTQIVPALPPRGRAGRPLPPHPARSTQPPAACLPVGCLLSSDQARRPRCFTRACEHLLRSSAEEGHARSQREALAHTGQECCEAGPCPVVGPARDKWREELESLDVEHFDEPGRVRFLEQAEQKVPDAVTACILAQMYWQKKGSSARALVTFRRAISLLTSSDDDAERRAGWQSELAHRLLRMAYHCKHGASPAGHRQVRAFEAEAAELLLQLPQPDYSDLYELGVCWLLGRGVPQSHARGVAALERAVACARPGARQWLAAYRLGCLWGAALPVDKRRAWSLFLSTAEEPGAGLLDYLHELRLGEWDSADSWHHFGSRSYYSSHFLAVALFELGRLCLAPWRHRLRGGVPADEGPWCS